MKSPGQLALTALVAVAIVLQLAGRYFSIASAGVTPPLLHADRPAEIPDDPPAPAGAIVAATAPGAVVIRDGYVSVQVNVDAKGSNILNDAANEPSIAVDPLRPARMAIGWRQFDSVDSNFREGGYGYTQDAGRTWTFPGVLEEGQFRSDPVLGADAAGNFYFYSLSSITTAEFFKSTDGGMTWTGPVNGFGGDKQWFTIDRTTGPGRSFLYGQWNAQFSCCPPNDFTRSTNGGESFEYPIALPPPSMRWGTLDVGLDGALYTAGFATSGVGCVVAKSSNLQHRFQVPTFDFVRIVNLGGSPSSGAGPNPAGLLGQVWIATDHSNGASRGNVYIAASVDPGTADPLDVMFIRSSDGGNNWSTPVRINDDSSTSYWQWFGTMSVAPNGRIDVIWNDTRNTGLPNRSEVHYSYSLDAGVTWYRNVPVTPEFNSHVGWPNQNKIGDYYHMVSDNMGANLAYAATFNGEQDVYYLRIGDLDCNRNGLPDAIEIANHTVEDCNHNEVPDTCEADCNHNEQVDSCDVTKGPSEDCNGDLVPDECQRDFDGDGTIDGCDFDSDNDGIANSADLCPFTPLWLTVNSRGRSISDINNNCVVELTDYDRLSICYAAGGPNISHGGFCVNEADYDFDTDLDLRDIAGFQNAFGAE